MGFLSNIKNSLSKSYEWLKSQAESIVEKVNYWKKKSQQYVYDYMRHKAYVWQVKNQQLEYSPEAVDVELKGRIENLLNKYNQGNVGKYLQELSFDERKSFLQKTLLPEIANEMEISVEFGQWFSDNSIQGIYSRKSQSISLNELYLTTNDISCLDDMINTIIHECKHARQYEAITGINTHGYSIDQIVKWKINCDDYISPEESDEGYFKQPMEWDAWMFADKIYPKDKNK